MTPFFLLLTTIQKEMNTTRYESWEAVQTEFAREVALECLETYQRGCDYYGFTVTNTTKTIMDYILCKVFYMLAGSTPSLGFQARTYKKEDGVRVCLNLISLVD